MELFQKIEEIVRRQDFKVNDRFLNESAKPNYPKTHLRIKGQFLLFKFDVDNHQNIVFRVFNPHVEDLTAINDYHIFYLKNDVLFIFICDLKSNKQSTKRQLEAGLVLSQHIVNMAKKQLGFKQYHVEYRGLVINTNSKALLSTSIKKKHFRKLKGSNLEYLSIKAGRTIFLDNLC